MITESKKTPISNIFLRQLNQNELIFTYPLDDGKAFKKRYEVVRAIHQNPRLKVILSIDKSTKIKYIAKQSFEVIQESRRSKQLQNQAKILSMITHKHPNIIKLKQFSQRRNQLLLITEYCNSGNLAKALRFLGTFSQFLAQKIFFQILRGVKFLHTKQRIVHRDLSLKNLMLKLTKKRGIQVKIIDYKLAIQLKQKSQTKSLSARVGETQFLAPEVLSKDGYGFPRDLWSCGVILLCMLTGRSPFEGNNEIQICRNILKLDVCGLIKEVSSALKLSGQLQDLLFGLLQRDPEKRLTIRQAINHDWFKMDRSQNYVDENTSDSLRMINNKSTQVVDREKFQEKNQLMDLQATTSKSMGEIQEDNFTAMINQQHDGGFHPRKYENQKIDMSATP